MLPFWPLPVITLTPASAGVVRWTLGGQPRATVVAKATFSLRHDESALPIEPEEIVRNDEPLGGTESVRRASDLAPRLRGARILVRGHACAPYGKPVPSLQARVAVFRDGQWLVDKTLHVYGDRPSHDVEPAPFVRMPLSYERAVGGPGDAENPVGAADGMLLPNIFDAQDSERPAGFGPIARSWKPRVDLAAPGGSPEAPNLPDNFDVGFFDPAPRDQIFDKIRGDEWIALEGLHPEETTSMCCLPGFSATAFLAQLGSDKPPTRLVLAADTLLIDTQQWVVSVLFRGDLPLLQGPSARQGFVVHVGPEGSLIQLPSKAELAERLFGIRAPAPSKPGRIVGEESTAVVSLAALRNVPTLPFVVSEPETATPTPPPPGPSNIGLPFEPTGLFDFASLPARPLVDAVSIDEVSIDDSETLPPPSLAAIDDSDTLPPPSLVPTIEDSETAPPSLSPFIEEVSAVFDEESTAATLRPPPRDAEAIPLMILKAPPPPVFDDLEPPTETRLPAVPSSIPPSISEVSAPASPPAPASVPSSAPPSLPSEKGVRGAVMARLVRGESVFDLDLAGAVLDGLDLRGVTLSHLDLAGASLVDANLEGVAMESVSLRGADLSGARLKGANLRGADLSRSILSKTELEEATLSGADLSHAKGEGTLLRGASLERVDLRQARLADVVLDHANLEGASGAQADLSGSSFLQANLKDVTLRGARLRGARLQGCKLSGADLRDADLTGATVTQGALDGARTAGAVLRDLVTAEH